MTCIVFLLAFQYRQTKHVCIHLDYALMYTQCTLKWSTSLSTLQTTQGNCATEGNSGTCHSGNCHSGERWMRKPSVHSGKWKSNEGIDNIANGPVNNMSFFYVIKWQIIRFQALWKTKSFVKVCLKFELPLWTKGLLIHLSPLWQLPLWHFPRWHNFPVYMERSIEKWLHTLSWQRYIHTKHDMEQVREACTSQCYLCTEQIKLDTEEAQAASDDEVVCRQAYTARLKK